MDRHTDILAGSPQRPEIVRGTQINMIYWVTESDKAKGLFTIGTLPLCSRVPIVVLLLIFLPLFCLLLYSVDTVGFVSSCPLLLIRHNYAKLRGWAGYEPANRITGSHVLNQ